MITTKLKLLKFIGGPFDGFAQQISEDADELPAGIALPINKKAARLFGLEGDNTDRVAIYMLARDEDVIQYRFRRVRRAG